jgi:hypothetical protein
MSMRCIACQTMQESILGTVIGYYDHHLVKTSGVWKIDKIKLTVTTVFREQTASCIGSRQNEKQRLNFYPVKSGPLRQKTY